jgi:hypothetical protein
VLLRDSFALRLGGVLHHCTRAGQWVRRFPPVGQRLSTVLTAAALPGKNAPSVHIVQCPTSPSSSRIIGLEAVAPGRPGTSFRREAW